MLRRARLSPTGIGDASEPPHGAITLPERSALCIVSSRLWKAWLGVWVATAVHELCRHVVQRVHHRYSRCHHAAVRPVGRPSDALQLEAWGRGMSCAGRIGHACGHSRCSHVVQRVPYECSRCHHAAVRPVVRFEPCDTDVRRPAGAESWRRLKSGTSPSQGTNWCLPAAGSHQPCTAPRRALRSVSCRSHSLTKPRGQLV